MAKRRLFISQRDSAFKSRNLLVASGGLCGPTCTLHFYAAAMASAMRRNVIGRNLDNMVAIVDRITSIARSDARRGTGLPALPAGAAQVFGDKFKYATYDPLNPPVPKVELPRLRAAMNSRDGLYLIEVAGTHEEIRHFVLVLKIDLESRTIIVSDPEYPNDVYRAKWVFKDERVHFQLKSPHGSSDVFIVDAAVLYWE